VVLTGDNHANWVNDLRIDDHKPEMPVIASEFVGTSISSSGDGADKLDGWDAIMAENPGVRLLLRSLHGDAGGMAERFSGVATGQPAGRAHFNSRILRDRSRYARR
jgi:phosphodiesterase/alkaline phosphatase D-like protein